LIPGSKNTSRRTEETESGTFLQKPVKEKEVCVQASLPPTIKARDGTNFINEPAGYRQIYEVPEYRFSDIRKDDIVVDIGANVGAFCIRAAYYSDYVYAIEPVTYEILQKNIILNGVSVTVLDCALGSGNVEAVGWDSVNLNVRTVSLKTVIGMVGGCDFLKCDCEGAEWLIDPRDLGKIRRIEMELHLPPIGGPPNPSFLDYISRNYNYQVDYMPSQAPLGLLGYLHATKGSGNPGG
jgi:hypothetical protein